MADEPKKQKRQRATKKIVTAPEATPVEATPEQPNVRHGSWGVDKLFWGLLLVTIGVLLLLGNLGVVSIDWANMWRLWPLAIVFAGLSLLGSKHWLWRLFSIVVVIAALAAVVALGTGAYRFDRVGDTHYQQTVQQDLNAKRAAVEIDGGASKLVIDSSDSAAIVDATLESHGLELKQESKLDGETQRVRLFSESHHMGWFMHGRNVWDVSLTNRLPLDVTINAGASAIDADLAKARLQNLTIDSGASAVTLKLGDVEKSLKVTIDSGASAVTIRVPNGVGVKLTVDGGPNSKQLADLKERGNGTYQSEGYDTAEKKIDIAADVGLASFTIERY